MIPFGHDVAQAQAEGRLYSGVLRLLVADEPRYDYETGRVVGAWSRWDRAKQYAASGSAFMVLPDGESVESYSWPRQCAEWRQWGPASLSVWAFGFSDEQCEPIGKGLVLAGFDAVMIQRFEVGRNARDLWFRAG